MQSSKINLVQVANLYKKVSKSFQIENVSFNIKKGECIHLQGTNGAGKTTILKLLKDYLHPDEGNITKQQDLIISCLVQEFNMYDELTIERNELLSTLYNKVAGVKPAPFIFQLTEFRKKRLKDCNFGTKKKLFLNVVMSVDAHLYLLDEPFDGLDNQHAKVLSDLIQSYKDAGKSFLITSHTDVYIENVVDKRLFIENGKILK
jgi:ABC-type multidrug transport system ATPase subunit